MKIKLHNKFAKKFGKLTKNEQSRCKARLYLFLEDPFNEALNNHSLHGRYSGFRSINISGDLRAVYEMLDNNTAFFVELGNHNNLYK